MELRTRWYRQYISLKEKKSDFRNNVCRALRAVSVEHCSKFVALTRRNTAFYRIVEMKTVSNKEIECFVKHAKTYRSALDH